MPHVAWPSVRISYYVIGQSEELEKTNPKLLVVCSTNRMQFDPQINTERDRLGEIVKMK